MGLVNTPSKGNAMTNHVVEAVTFRLASGITDTDFVGTLGATNAYLKTCPGFVSRRLSRAEDGTWLDHIEWETLDAAHAAAKAFPAQPTVAPFIRAIDPGSAQMRHNTIVTSLE